MPFTLRRSRLRVGLAPGLAELARGTGHGNVWAQVLSELARNHQVKLLTRGRADVWLANGHEEPPEGRPLVVQIHEAGWRDPVLRSVLHPDFAERIDAATGSALAAAAHVITPSSASRQQVMDAYDYPAERLHVISHGVRHDVFSPGLSGGRGRVGAPYVLFVAVLHPRKNFAAVRQAVADLAAAGLSHVLAIVASLPPEPRGDEFARQATRELPGYPGRVIVFRDLPSRDLAALMAGADVFCLPSWYEGFGLPALEAMACGTPVVVSDRGALPEVVGDAGIVSAPEAAAVSDAVRRVIADPELAAGLRRRAVARAAPFSWERTAAGWLEVLKRAASELPPPASSSAPARRVAADA